MLTEAFRERDRVKVQHEKLRRLAASHAGGRQVWSFRQRQKLEQELERMRLQLQLFDEQGQHISFLYPPLQELELNGRMVESRVMDKIIRYLSSLIRLTIRGYLSADVNMKAFLRGCPFLESIVLVSVELGPYDNCWLSEDLECQSVLRLRQLNL